MSETAPAARSPSRIDGVADAWMDTLAALDPHGATLDGIAGHDAEVTSYSPVAFDARADAARRTLGELDAAAAEQHATGSLDAVDAVTLEAMRERLGLDLERHAAGIPQMAVNNIASPLQHARQVFDLMPQDTEADWEAIADRLTLTPSSLETWIASLRWSAERGRFSARRQLELGAAQAAGYADPRTGPLADLAAPEELPATLRRRVEEGVADTAAAYHRLAGALAELAPRAPAADAVGRERYALESRFFLGAEVDLDETYEWGIDHLQRIIAEQTELAAAIVGRDGAGVAEARAVLDADPARTLHGTDALQGWMQSLSARALDELGATHFDIPRELRSLACRIASTGAGGIYYTPPSEDFSRPGTMWWDVPPGVDVFHTWTEATTVYHEGVPGHHLQLGTAALASGTLNRWRRLGCWVSGTGEGWALYAERLMADLGHLDDPGDRLGMLDSQRLRAGRVLLDLGLHLGKQMPPEWGEGVWTYEKAWAFMGPNWGGDPESRRFELNRYAGWPGQAPSYAIGQRLWERIRDQRRAAEGARFSLRSFHRDALAVGGVGLDALGRALTGAAAGASPAAEGAR